MLPPLQRQSCFNVEARAEAEDAEVTAADEVKELVIGQRVWAVIVQDEPQQKTGQLKPESSATGLD